ncbi:MAG: TM2 domain-containing protein [Prevotella sp.]|nr:TM2 domain-containing protein [Prevotella sp.]
MEQKQADQLIVMNSSKLAPEYIESIRERLLDMDYSQAAVYFGNLKDPTLAIILSIIIGELGVDRFYIGDIGMGVGKLLVTVIVGTISCGTLFWIWWLIDIFLIMGATRKKNSETLLQSLSIY